MRPGYLGAAVPDPGGFLRACGGRGARGLARFDQSYPICMCLEFQSRDEVALPPACWLLRPAWGNWTSTRKRWPHCPPTYCTRHCNYCLFPKGRQLWLSAGRRPGTLSCPDAESGCPSAQPPPGAGITVVIPGPCSTNPGPELGPAVVGVASRAG